MFSLSFPLETHHCQEDSNTGLFYTNSGVIHKIRLVKRENLAGEDTGKDPQYMPLSFLHPALSHTHSHAYHIVLCDRDLCGC